MVKSKPKRLKHPLHSAIVHIPVALWPAAFIFDLLSQFSFGGNALVRTSFYAIVFGLMAALIAVPTGALDWAEIRREKPAWRLGLYHMMINLVVIILFGMNLGLRLGTFQEGSNVARAPLLFSALGNILLLASAYLGGRMVYDQGISVARHSKEKWRRLAQEGNAQVPPADGEEPA